MKSNIKKIAAFTLTEMLVVLTLSTIVAGLAFSILSLVNRNLNVIQLNYSRSSQISLFQQQLTVDFNQLHDLDYDGITNELRCSTPLDTVVYSFSEDHILRNLDTLYRGKFATEFLYRGSTKTSGSVDAIKLELELDQPVSVFVYKRNDAYQKLRSHGN